MNLEKLKEIIRQSGLKKAFIAESLGITDGSLRNKLSGRTNFTWREIQVLARILHLSAEICDSLFFTSEVADSATKGA